MDFSRFSRIQSKFRPKPNDLLSVMLVNIPIRESWWQFGCFLIRIASQEEEVKNFSRKYKFTSLFFPFSQLVLTCLADFCIDYDIFFFFFQLFQKMHFFASIMICFFAGTKKLEMLFSFYRLISLYPRRYVVALFL